MSSRSRSLSKRALAYGASGIAGGVGHPAAVGEAGGEGRGEKVRDEGVYGECEEDKSGWGRA
jgi:hypothetical protein